MALHVLPYAVEHYNSLPGLRVRKTNSNEILSFVKHHVENTLGIAQLHNHFLLEHHELLMNVDSEVVP